MKPVLGTCENNREAVSPYRVKVSDDFSNSSHSMWNTLEKESWKQSNNTYWEICLRIHWKLSRHRHTSLWNWDPTFSDNTDPSTYFTTLKPTSHYWEPCSYCFSYWPTEILIWVLFVFAFLPAVNEHVTFRFSLYLLKILKF